MGKTCFFFLKILCIKTLFAVPIPANIAALFEKCISPAGNTHLLLGQAQEEFSFVQGFTLGCKEIISSSAASDTLVSLSLTAKWSKVNCCV